MVSGFPWLIRRFAACLALAAAFAFVLSGALARDHHFGETPADGVYHGVHVHFHLPGSTDAPHHAAGDIEGPGDGVAGHHHGSAPHGSAPNSGSDAGCCFAACYVGVMLPCPNFLAEPLTVPTDLSGPSRASRDGIEPEGPRKPPRPAPIA